MASKIIYTCDRCGATSTTRYGLLKVYDEGEWCADILDLCVPCMDVVRKCARTPLSHV